MNDDCTESCAGKPEADGGRRRCSLAGAGVGAGRGSGKLRQALLQTALLSCLAEGEAHGYALIDAASSLVGAQACVDPGTVYRILRSLEAEGCVVSRWESPTSGPGRRVYEITGQGRDLLRHWCVFLERRAAGLLALASRGREALGEPGQAGGSGDECRFCEEAFFD